MNSAVYLFDFSVDADRVRKRCHAVQDLHFELDRLEIDSRLSNERPARLDDPGHTIYQIADEIASSRV